MQSKNFLKSLSLRFKPRCFTSHLRQTKTRHMLSCCSSAAAQEKVLFISELNQSNSQLPRGGFTDALAMAAFYSTLPCAHTESVQRSKLQTTLHFTKMFSVLLLTGSAHHPARGPGMHCRDKEARKAGAAQLSVVANHKLSWIVSSSYTLPHLMAPA